MLAKLPNVYAHAKDGEEAARLLGVTEGAARQAKRRYLDWAATDTGLKKPVEARRQALSSVGRSPSLLFKKPSVTRS